MIEFLLILIITLGLWLLALQINCAHLRTQLEQNRKVLGQVIKNQDEMAIAIGTDVKQLRERLDTLERD